MPLLEQLDARRRRHELNNANVFFFFRVMHFKWFSYMIELNFMVEVEERCDENDGRENDTREMLR